MGNHYEGSGDEECVGKNGSKAAVEALCAGVSSHPGTIQKQIKLAWESNHR